MTLICLANLWTAVAEWQQALAVTVAALIAIERALRRVRNEILYRLLGVGTHVCVAVSMSKMVQPCKFMGGVIYKVATTV